MDMAFFMRDVFPCIIAFGVGFFLSSIFAQATREMLRDRQRAEMREALNDHEEEVSRLQSEKTVERTDRKRAEDTLNDIKAILIK